MKRHWLITNNTGKQVPFFGTMIRATKKAQDLGFKAFRIQSSEPVNNGTLLAR